MSDPDPNEETQKFFARQLLEINQSLAALNQRLAVLPEIKTEISETKQHLAMIKGWMDGQEEVSLAQARRLNGIHESLETVGKRLHEYGQRADAAIGFVTDMQQQLRGVIELSKSTFEIVTDLKTMQQGKGGEHEASNNRSATQ